MTTPPPEEKKRPEDEQPEAKPETDLATQQQQQQLQQQLQQQQLQLLQFQTQQLQNLSPSEITAMSQQLALFMMPMMPFMVPTQQQSGVEGAAGETTAATAPAEPTGSATESEASPPFHPSTTESSGLTPPPGTSDSFGLLSASFGNLTAPATEEAPKRKRGRPPKKDAAKAKAESEKNSKQQFPMWGYGLPMPLLSGLPGLMPPVGNSGAVVKDPSTDEQVKEEDEGERPAKVAKKKARGTGKPRGRPRTRPRPGEVIRRAKLLPIAPANFSVMYNYSLSNLAQKNAELHGEADATTDVTAAATGAETETISTEDPNDENRLAPLATSLLSEEHE